MPIPRLLNLYPAPSWFVSDRLGGGQNRIDMPSPPQPRGRASSTDQQFDDVLYAILQMQAMHCRRRYAREDTPTFRNTSIMFSSPSTLTLEDNGMREGLVDDRPMFAESCVDGHLFTSNDLYGLHVLCPSFKEIQVFWKTNVEYSDMLRVFSASEQPQDNLSAKESCLQHH
ncbi:uncharacterized protein ARMOST_16396 [Armillaria ostoyae]|uniref:Uncharacterized protein n=1 Tax=Armillaria ostoyae TaxID=47428 RepID=A0A284RW41_ARMOS|nr:uncharacterized protein ARMOST_16396 [Armillaria ostoyae]